MPRPGLGDLRINRVESNGEPCVEQFGRRSPERLVRAVAICQFGAMIPGDDDVPGAGDKDRVEDQIEEECLPREQFLGLLDAA